MENLPKSLHTVKVLVKVARFQMGLDSSLEPREAVSRVLVMLGYRPDVADSYQLQLAAIRQLKAFDL